MKKKKTRDQACIKTRRDSVHRSCAAVVSTWGPHVSGTTTGAVTAPNSMSLGDSTEPQGPLDYRTCQMSIRVPDRSYPGGHHGTTISRVMERTWRFSFIYRPTPDFARHAHTSSHAGFACNFWPKKCHMADRTAVTTPWQLGVSVVDRRAKAS